jgi:trk system potassium uptake protein TrkA
MYVIIVGGGDVGHYLCKEFLNMGHEALVIEKEAKKCESLKDELGSVAVCGDGCEIAVLTKAGIARADIVIAVTSEDDDNLAACQIAKQKFNVPQVIARVNNPKNEHIFAKLGVEHTVDAVALMLENIKAQTAIFPLLKERGSELFLVRVTQGSLAGKSVKDLSLPLGSVVSLLIRQERESRMPDPNTVLEPGDQLVCLIPSGSEESLRAIIS